MSKSDNALKAGKGRDKTSSKKSSTNGESRAAKRRGRPSGKRSDPEFVQTTAYIRADTYKATKIALIQEDQSREYSELVEDLLSQWLKSLK